MKPDQRAVMMMGNIALAEGALAAGCRFYAGYPITPVNEISEYLSRRLPEMGGIFIQMEDEIASIGAVMGAAWAGAKALTATSGPGFTLMQEHIGHAATLEVPLVIANLQRAGPGGGGITEMSAEVMQAKWGAHGDYQIIALAPTTVQEMFDLTVEAFNYAGIFRCPVFLLSDGLLAHTYEAVHIPSAEELQKQVVEWPAPQGDPKDYIPFSYEDPHSGELIVPPPPRFGTPFQARWSISGPHLERGGFVADPRSHLTMISRMHEKILRHQDRIDRVETRFMEDATSAVICYGTAARPALRAVKEAQLEGIKVGYLRLITLWPFPEKAVREVCQQVKWALVPEMNYGQLVREVERTAGPWGCRVRLLRQVILHSAGEILQAIKEVSQ